MSKNIKPITQLEANNLIDKADEIAEQNKIFKAILPSTNVNIANQLGVKVDDEMINLVKRDDNIRMRLLPGAKINSERSATYTQLTAMTYDSATNPFFAEGTTPNGTSYATNQASKLKKSLGMKSGITNVALAVMQGKENVQTLDSQYMSAFERQMAILDTEYRNAEDWAIINGNTTTDALMYDGLDAEIVTANGSLEVDLSGSSITKEVIDNVIAAQSLMGYDITAIYANPLIINTIKQLYYYTNSLLGQPDPWGFNTITTSVGDVALVPDKRIHQTFVSGDDFTSTIFLITEQKEGVDLLYIDYLIPQSIITPELLASGSNATSTEFAMYSHGTLVNKAPTAQAKIINAGYQSIGAMQTTLVAESNKII